MVQPKLNNRARKARSASAVQRSYNDAVNTFFNYRRDMRRWKKLEDELVRDYGDRPYRQDNTEPSLDELVRRSRR